MKFERRIKQWLRERNVYFGKKSSVQQIDDFLRLVYPVKTNHNLIRVGKEMDGAYLVPDDLLGIDACFSPGVSLESHFEDDLAKMGIRSFLADYSVDTLPIGNPLFDFEKKYLGMSNDEIHISLEDWVMRKVGESDGDLILQMDIEGSEYEVIFDASYELLRRFRIIVVEFHRLEALLDRYGYILICSAFKKLLKDFLIVHIHPNNQTSVTKFKDYMLPSEMEFTFLRRNRISSSSYVRSFPHPLDVKNIKERDELVLPACWYAPPKTNR